MNMIRHQNTKSVTFTSVPSNIRLQILLRAVKESNCVQVSSANQEETDEMNEAYIRVELEYKRFLLECGVSES